MVGFGYIMVNRDPYIWVVFHPLYTPNNQAFFHCSGEFKHWLSINNTLPVCNLWSSDQFVNPSLCLFPKRILKINGIPWNPNQFFKSPIFKKQKKQNHRRLISCRVPPVQNNKTCPRAPPMCVSAWHCHWAFPTSYKTMLHDQVELP